MEQHFSKNEKIRILALEQKFVDTHSHDFFELVYIKQGSGIHVLNGEKSIVRKGDFLIIDLDVPHRYENIENSRFEIVNILFKPEFIDKTLYGCRRFKELLHNYLIRFSYDVLYTDPTATIFHDSDLHIAKLVEKLSEESGNKHPGYLELMRCNLIEIIIRVIRSITKEAASVIYSDYSRYMITYIEENYMKKLKLDQICKKTNYSLPYLSKKFKEDLGMTYTDYLQRTRVMQSCRLLANTDKKVSEIAGLVGYSDTKFFDRVFKKHIDMTPRDFRRMHSKDI